MICSETGADSRWEADWFAVTIETGEAGETGASLIATLSWTGPSDLDLALYDDPLEYTLAVTPN
jgi:hypothetical protein